MTRIDGQRHLFIGGDTPLPPEFITESSAILAKKGAGKTNAAIVLLEEAYAVGVPVVSIDPKGDHWGVRAGADGTPKGGLPVVVFGGLHADVPLEPTAGAYVAELIRSTRLSAVLDVSEFLVGERARFLTAFADRLYRYDSRDPMLLILEEAHEYIPQRVGAEEAKMVSSFERLVKLGRSKGLGVVMVTQRSASLNKNVLTQADNLFVMRTTAPQDKAVVKAWLDNNADPALVSELGSLQTGEAILVQPQRGEPLRFRFRMRHTYDAGRTPVVGEAPRPPATLADVDLGAVREAMAATIEKAKADDPKVLRALIAERDKTIAQLGRELELSYAARPEPERVEVPVLTDEDRRTLTDHVTLLHQGVLALMRTAVADVDRTADKLLALAQPTRELPAPPARSRVELPAAPAQPLPSSVRTIVKDSGAPAEVRLGKAHRGILAVLAQYGPRTQQQVATLTGYSAKGGGFGNALSSLRSGGLVVGGRDRLEITDAGVAAVGVYESLPEPGAALLEHWRAHPKVGRAHRAVLDVLAGAGGGPLTREEIAEQTGYEVTGGGFNNALSLLRGLGLIVGRSDAIELADELRP